MGIKTKVLNQLSNLEDDIAFLRRKDVSWLFKFLNILSGDRLRHAVVIAGLTAYNTRQYLDGIKDMTCYDDIPIEYYKSSVDRVSWFLKREALRISDIYRI